MQNLIIKGSSEKIGEDFGLQPELLTGEIEHSVINKSNSADLRPIWEPYPGLDELCSAFIYARHSMKMQKLSGFGNTDFN